MRIRVSIDVRKPMKQSMRIKKVGEGENGCGLLLSMRGSQHFVFSME